VSRSERIKYIKLRAQIGDLSISIFDDWRQIADRNV